ncbi:UNVERIFIED_CONTAM: NADPh quinone reductase, partial [Siphonaria sp. JEL0065]
LYDAVLDNVSTYSTKDVCKAVVPGGTVVSIGRAENKDKVFGGMISLLVSGMNPFKDKSRNVESFMADAGGNCLRELIPLIEKGALTTVIDKQFTFDQVFEAFDYLEGGHVAGKVIISVP